MNPLLELIDVHCGYPQQTVINGVCLSIRAGMLSCLLGPSGCGKTTVLRAIAGFEPVRQGKIRLNGRDISRPGHTLPPESRHLGMVFQDYALFPHLSIADNVAFGLRAESRRQRRKTAERFLELVGLSGAGARFPHELSGGQQQRVAVARALAPQPRLLLLDEPFSNLDVDLRERLANDVRDILKQQGMAAIFVTHDQHEAFVMGERIAVMHAGRICQWDAPFELYHKPASRFVADFIGQGRFIAGTLLTPNKVDTEIGVLTGDGANTNTLVKGQKVDVLLRPDDVRLCDESSLRATVTQRAFKGAETLYTLKLASGQEILSLVPSHQDYPTGQQIGLRLNLQHLIVFAQQ